MREAGAASRFGNCSRCERYGGMMPDGGVGAEYQPLFDNAKKLRALLTELQDLTLQIIEEGGTTEP